MANKQVVFPVGKEAQATAYRNWTNAQFDLLFPGVGMFGYGETVIDRHGQRVEAFLGLPFEYPVGTPLDEPAGGAAMRADGIIVDAAEMPIVD
ncbi:MULTISPECIES: hypothetical protein [unclassified Rhizobium]|uniref:hypothetical protein n=1 Tax=unclassified Rhizobium TaxID=2613769 RepID=UPI0006FBA5BF|nr:MULTISPECIES: hypothetical protein [unclassified Rhizobium]KQV36453.1 hypothetical protein ASC86_24770 [Rhizobium sp. Root1212]KRD26743.1 hypothetical protein ASE37_24685 [Rhizobium sp. Root268]